jgi:hypothetical protein
MEVCMSGKRFLHWLVVLGVAATLIVNMLANTLPINGLNTGQISDRFEVYFVPAGYVFSIWGLIYVGLAAYAVFQILPLTKENERLDKIPLLFLVSSTANIAWIFFWHYLLFGWSLVAMLVLLLSLIMIYLRLGIGKTPLDPGEFWFVRVPISIYLGWISVATIANVTSYLDYIQWSGWGISEATWAATMLVVATILGWVMALTRKDIPYLVVFVWAFVGIAVKHQGTSLVALSAWAAAGLCALAILMIGIQKLTRKP